MKKKVLVSALFALCVAPLAACGGGDDTDKAYAVSVSQTEHGTVAVSAEKAHKGDRITVTVTPDKCYELQTLMCGDMEITSAKSFVMPDNKVTITAVFKEGAHEWGDWSVIDNSTCIKHGSKTRECEECHKIVSEDLELADHDYEFKSDGNVHKKVCTVCSDVEAGSEDTHTYVFSTAGADSIEHWKTCKDCGDIDKETVHAYHTMTGDTCSVCGYEQAAATEGLAYTDIDADTCSVSGMGLADTRDVVIPAFHDGKRVTAIADNAFENETLLESIVIPDSVVTVGESAFGNCSALAKVTIGKNVRSFGW